MQNIIYMYLFITSINNARELIGKCSGKGKVRVGLRSSSGRAASTPRSAAPARRDPVVVVGLGAKTAAATAAAATDDRARWR